MARLAELAEKERVARLQYAQALSVAKAKEAEALRAVVAAGAASVRQAQERNAQLAATSLADAQVCVDSLNMCPD
jgi:hypothetical protein